MLKKLVLALALAAGAVAVAKRVQDQRAEQELWAEATDDIRSSQGH